MMRSRKGGNAKMSTICEKKSHQDCVQVPFTYIDNDEDIKDVSRRQKLAIADDIFVHETLALRHTFLQWRADFEGVCNGKKAWVICYSYRQYEGPSSANENERKLGLYNRKWHGNNYTCLVLF